MSSERFSVIVNDNCVQCGFCSHYVGCPAVASACIGCGICIKGCPQNARSLEPRRNSGAALRFSLDGENLIIQGPITVRQVLRSLGKSVGGHADQTSHATCDTGGCWNCAVWIDGELKRSCLTPLTDGMAISTDSVEVRDADPLRVVTTMRPAPHHHPSIFTHGCNYSCDLCHNWEMTFASAGRTCTPVEAVDALRLDVSRDYWVGISGGEPTLNRPWLVKTVRRIREVHPEVRIQLDTNASILTPDYIDELVDAGVTDLSPDLKARTVRTFMLLCGITSEPLARSYLETSWNAVAYVDEKYRGRVFMAVSLPYHPRVHTQEELLASARAVAAINPEMPVTLIEYQPAFRLRDWPFVTAEDIDQARIIVESVGLKRVIVQGGTGVPLAVDPFELELSSEEF